MAAAAADSHADALRYMKTVKASLGSSQPETYRQFIDVLSDFKNGTMGVAEVMSRVAALFRDTPDLIFGFNAFLPKCYQIGLSDEQPGDMTKEPMNFVKAVKDRHPETCRDLLRVLEDYIRSGIRVAEVASRVAALFRDNPDLIAGFDAMLPRGHEMQVVPGVDEHQLAVRFVKDVNLDDNDDHMIN